MEYLKGALMDTSVDVRRKAKIAFIKYNSLYASQGLLLIQTIDYTYQKGIYDEYLAIGIDPESVFED